MKKYIYIIAVCVIIILSFVAQFYSHHFSLWVKGLSTQNIVSLDKGFDGNGEVFEIVKTSSKNSDIVLAYLSKNAIGFWYVAYTTNDSDGSTPTADIAEIGWMSSPVGRLFAGEPQFSIPSFFIWYGENAIAPVTIRSEQFPPNTAFIISQGKNQYTIKAIVVMDSDSITIDMESILKSNGCIK